jgi:hypothetical protein
MQSIQYPDFMENWLACHVKSLYEVMVVNVFITSDNMFINY